jgi:thiol-disulfide isomerase/thioredoxin
MKRIIPILLLFLACSVSQAQQSPGYHIDVSIKGLTDSTIYLAYHFGDKQYLKDTVKVDKTGKAVFQGKESLPQGIYMIVLPGRRYFEILISDDQNFSAECQYENFSSTLKFTGSDENNAFVAYQRKWGAMQQASSSISKRIQANKINTDSLNTLGALQKNQEEKMKAYLHSVTDENKGNLLGMLVKSLIPIEIPPFSVPPNSANPDSVRWVKNYMYNKDHFFDNLDLNDERILRTPIYFARLDAFFREVVIQAPDSINREIDRLIKKVEKNYKIYQYTAVYLFNHFRESEIMGHDAVMVKLADEIYLTPKADWVTKEFKDDLRRQIDLIRPNLIGKRAQNLIMDSYKGIYVSLDDVDREFTVLYFWEPTCGHCQEATPKLKAWYEKPHDYTVEVFAVCTTDEKDKWTKYIEENHLQWINGWDPKRSSHFDAFYNVQSTPMVYILDKNKKIIAKKLSVEDIDNFINNYRKYYRK